MPPSNVRSWRHSLHRGVALGLTIVLHLVVFVLITRPVADEEDQKAFSRNASKRCGYALFRG